MGCDGAIDMDKQTLARKIWDSANAMRASGMNAVDYKDFILGFIFYKYLSDKEVAYLKKNGFEPSEFKDVLTPDNEQISTYCGNNIGYYIPHMYLYSTWLELGYEFTIKTVTDSIRSFKNSVTDTYRKVYDNIFDAFEANFGKIGMSSDKDQTKFASKLVQIVKEIPTDNKGFDTLGFIYEYLIGQFAANAGKKAGEFYTPHEVSLFMAEIVANHLKDRQSIQIYDPTCGSGSLLINIGDAASAFLDRNKIEYYGQEWKNETYNIARMNLLMRGVLPSNTFLRKTDDTLGEDWPMFEEGKPETYQLLRVDAVVSNPPYSQPWDPPEAGSDRRFDYGLAPKGKADFAFLQHSLYHLKPDGIMAIVLPHGVLFRGNEEYEIRKKLVQNNHVDTIIGLPENMFFGTSIQTLVMILRKDRKENDILFIDASRGYVKNGNKNALRMSDVKRIVDTAVNRSEIPFYSRRVAFDEVKRNDFNLNIPRYVESSDKSERYDLYATVLGGMPPEDIDSLQMYWDVFPNLKQKLFKPKDDGYYEEAVEDLKKAIREDDEVKGFSDRFMSAFNGFDEYLTDELVRKFDTLNVTREDGIIKDALFSRVEPIPLVDKYDLYQLFSDVWTEARSDMELIKVNGLDEARAVDDVFQIKKTKDSYNYEDKSIGKRGRIIPFGLIQSTYYGSELQHIEELDVKVAELETQLRSMIEDLTPEEKDEDFYDPEKDTIVSKEAKRYIKNNPDEDVSLRLKTYMGLESDLKETKKQAKAESSSLEAKTIEKIESLSDDEIWSLLEQKWVESIVSSILKTPTEVIKKMTADIKHVADKYAIYLKDCDERSTENSKQLSEMLDQLVGSEKDMTAIQVLKRLLDD